MSADDFFAEDVEVAMPLEMDEAIVNLISEDRVKVPPVPAVAFEIQKLLSGKDANVEKVADVVSRDQALSAAVLRAANGARFAAAREATTIRAALARIGFKDLVSLAFASALSGDVTQSGPLVEVRRVLWQRGLAASVLAREVAKETGVLDDETAQLCGLLYDFGRVFAVSAVETVLNEYEDAQALVLDDWLNVIEKYHTELGIVIASKWDLPSPISEVMSCRDNPAAAGEHEQAVVLVSTVSRIVDQLFRTPRVPPILLDRLVSGNGASIEACEEAISRLPPQLANLVEAAKMRFPKANGGMVKDDLFIIEDPEAPPQGIARAHLKSTEADHDVVQVYRNGFTIISEQPLEENFVTEAKFIIEGEQPIPLYTTVRSCKPGAQANEVELQLFCASPSLKRDFWAASRVVSEQGA